MRLFCLAHESQDVLASTNPVPAAAIVERSLWPTSHVFIQLNDASHVRSAEISRSVFARTRGNDGLVDAVIILRQYNGFEYAHPVFCLFSNQLDDYLAKFCTIGAPMRQNFG